METASCAWKGVIFEAWGKSEIFNQYCSHVQWGVMNEATINHSVSLNSVQVNPIRDNPMKSNTIQ